MNVKPLPNESRANKKMTKKIESILRGSAYSFSDELFSIEEINLLENRIEGRVEKKITNYYATCLIRGRQVLLKPEEVVRQLFLSRLINYYGYNKNRIQVEYPVQFGADKSKRADIVVFDKDRPTVVYILIELKKLKSKDGKDQLKSYCNATGAPIGVWTNGAEISYYQRKDPNIFDEIREIPNESQSLRDILNERFTIFDLIKEDKLKAKSLKKIIEEFEDEVLANAGVDVFEEAFKLVFTKLYDEFKSAVDKDSLRYWLKFNPKKTISDIPDVVVENFRDLQFRNTGAESETKRQIESLFEAAKDKWKGIFLEGAKIDLSPSHLQTCVSYLENVKLFNSNLEIIDEAFEYLVNKNSKGEKGQYFTPRYIIDMCVKMLNPKPDEFMIDTASGSCGFPVHTIFYVWNILNPNAENSFTTDEKSDAQKKYVENNVFAIDFDLKAVRVGRTLNLIAGDGETNVLHLNSLDYERWEVDNKDNDYWNENFGAGFRRLKRLQQKRSELEEFNFDVLMANPPFAGDIKDQRLIHKYELGKKQERMKQSDASLFAASTDRSDLTPYDMGAKQTRDKGWQEKISRDILFIERNLDMLREGGRMAIVLPQGRFNNLSDWGIRKYIAERCRILAVVGLHGNSFKPHTGTKTSVLFIQKWTDKEGICPRQDDYKIFFATQKKEGKDNSGDKIYWRADRTGITTETEEALRDLYDHPIVYHDLFSVETKTGEPTPEGIAEAFIEFACRENLSFF